MCLMTHAVLEDSKEIASLIHYYYKKKLMLDVDDKTVQNQINNFFIAKKKFKFVGCCSLYYYSPKLVEIRSLGIFPHYHSLGIGGQLLDYVLQQAKKKKALEVFVLTKEVHFFKKHQFLEIKKEALPEKIWKDCLGCASYPHCEETAMLKKLI